MSDSSNLADLKLNRRNIKSAITRLQNSISDKENDIQLLQTNLEQVTDLFKQYNSVQFDIEKCQLSQENADEDKLEEESNKERGKVENQYRTIISKIKGFLVASNPPTSNASTSNPNSTVINITNNNPNVKDKDSFDNVNLKPLPLPNFTGKHSEWFTFYESFKCLVGDDPNISNICKLHYLRGCLKDDALRAIERLSITGDNYANAIDLLKNRFENTRLIVQEHVSNILNIQPLVKSSHSELRTLIDTVNNNIAAMDVLKLPIKHWDALLVPIILEKLDFASRKEWQTTLGKEVPTYKSFNEFLEKRYQILNAMNNMKFGDNQNSKNKFPSKSGNAFSKQNSESIAKPNKFSANVVSANSCFICKKHHSVFQCKDFLEKTVENRIKLVNSLKLCDNCLRNNHDSQNCKSASVCKECKQKHHTLLHVTEFVPARKTSLVITETNQVLFSTILLLISNKEGNFYCCRAVLDQCSEVSLITEKMCKKLDLPTYSTNASITGVNISENIAHKGCNVKIKSRVGNFTSELECFVMPKITRATPAVSFDKSIIELPADVILADPDFNVSQEIDLLIGARLYWQLLIGGPIQLQKGQPYFQETLFGWIISGDLDLKNSSAQFTCNLISKFEDNLEKQVAKFWESENMEPELFESLELQKCEDHFRKNTFRTESGRFVVKLPVKDNISLGESRTLALKRFLSQEKRFEKDHKLAISYKEFMTEYLNLQHMELVPFSELKKNGTFYVPHLAVYKQTIDGPKIRIVYDCSAKSSNGLSLNDCLYTGGNIQRGLFDILCRFRTYQFAISADITKMYRMIQINSEDADLLRILWRDNTNEEIKTFRLKTLTYGLTCAPFLAIRCLKQLALETRESHPTASVVIDRDFYMDDLLTGSNSVNEALQIKNQVTSILATAGFELCKWSANDSSLLAPNSNTNSTINFSKNDEVKVLGFFWNCSKDELKYRVKIPGNVTATKRNILSIVAKIFDPLGLINPVVVKVKILLQKMWVLKLDWDQAVPKDIELIWIKILNELTDLNDYRIPRKLMTSNLTVLIELHGFADASSKAYGAAVYIKTIDVYGNSSVTLLCAKSKVAPIKTITLPRLELNAAVLLCRLMIKISSIINLQINSKYFWTDSTIVLCWLVEPADNWSQYVANRINEIQTNTNISEWHHVKSSDNAADVVSRGMLPRQLKESNLWWHGPEWLKSSPDEWPLRWTKPNKDNHLITERKSKTVNIIHLDPELPVMQKFSSFRKLQRVIAYCLRFINKLKSKITIKQNSLSVEEIKNADIAIFKYIQSRTFANEIQAIQNSKINKCSKISKLDPFIDDNGLLRVGGRLRHAFIDFDNKHPILLPKGHHVTKIIIRQFHEDELHAGKEGTLAAVRQRFWPIDGRNIVRKVVHTCVRCVRANPKPLHQKMGNLPKERVQPARPFLCTGVDYAGPYLIKASNLRNSKKVKAYIALFVCFSTKAIHLELVGDLTTECFLAAFKRFTSRRGHVNEIFSDNGSNFVGAERELFRTENFKNKITSHFLNVSTKFSFIPARSPHFGGLWERSIQSVKHHLKRVLGDASITYEEFYTLLTRIEACLNSRPLIPLSQDPNDLQALTPGHFLIGAPLTAPTEVDITHVPTNRLSRWQRLQQLQQHFWKRWQKEYLSQLQKRPKGHQVQQPNIPVGALVVLVDENVPPMQWRLGRVAEVHPGADRVVRVVTVKTNSGVFKRAINKVCVIPTEIEH